MTVYEYDGDRLVRSVTTHDAEFTPRNRLWATALQLHEDLTCECGGWVPETTDPANRDAYRTDPPVRCHKCTAHGRASERHKDSPQAWALRFPTRLVPLERRRQGPRKRVELTPAQIEGAKVAQERARATRAARARKGAAR